MRVLDAYNSGVQTGGYASPMRRREALRMDAADGQKLGIADGERVRVVSRRGAVEAPVAFDPSLRPGLASFTPHFTEEVDINVLTNDAWDPKSGTSEFKATAIRVEKLPAEAAGAARAAGIVMTADVLCPRRRLMTADVHLTAEARIMTADCFSRGGGDRPGVRE